MLNLVGRYAKHLSPAWDQTCKLVARHSVARLCTWDLQWKKTCALLDPFRRGMLTVDFFGTPHARSQSGVSGAGMTALQLLLVGGAWYMQFPRRLGLSGGQWTQIVP
mmetsp:Transcript_14972/g.28950  ORF Transcript_14972/g.28950 Transcript_14972/m.28950 type:complete len:107 (+) Transcript_14972:965-1285(+)